MLRTSGSVAAGFAWLLLHELGSGRELPYPQISLLRPCGHLLTLWITCIIAFSCCAACSCLWEETVSNPKCVARTTREKTFKCSQRCLGGKDCASLHMQLSDQGHSETQRPCSLQILGRQHWSHVFIAYLTASPAFLSDDTLPYEMCPCVPTTSPHLL